MKQGLAFCLLMCSAMLSHAQDETILAMDSSDIQSIRNEILDEVYGDEPVPEFRLLAKSNSKSMLALQYPPENMSRMETGVVNLKHGFTSRIYIMHPVKDNGLNVPIIYHSGHGHGVFREDVLVNLDEDSLVGRLTIGYFLSKGYTVVGIDMPFFGENKSPQQVVENNSIYSIYGHNDLFYLQNPFYYFMAPVKSVIDYLQTKRNCNEFIMYGLSGGGWTTTLYSALDTRVRLSFPIAGSIPMPLREARDMGDLEQNYAPFYDRFNYTTLYFLGAVGAGRQQYQILIKKDHCCFAVDGRLLWAKEIQNSLRERSLPGSFEFFYDTISNTHRISAVAVDSMQAQIIADMIEEKLREAYSLTSSRESNTICENDTIQLSVSEPGTNQFEWYYNGDKIDTAASNNLVVAREGNYNAVVRNISGAVISTRALEVKRQNIFTGPSISRSGDILYSSYTSGNSWYYNGKRIAGAGASSLQLSKPGRYTLRVSEGNCTSEFSAPYDFGVTAFPNPSSVSLTVRLPRELQAVSWSLRAAQGSQVMNGEFVGETVIRYNGIVKPGVYFLILKNRSGFNSVQKIIVSN